MLSVIECKIFIQLAELSYILHFNDNSTAINRKQNYFFINLFLLNFIYNGIYLLKIYVLSSCSNFKDLIHKDLTFPQSYRKTLQKIEMAHSKTNFVNNFKSSEVISQLTVHTGNVIYDIYRRIS